jgi:hypothetical protein
MVRTHSLSAVELPCGFPTIGWGPDASSGPLLRFRQETGKARQALLLWPTRHSSGPRQFYRYTQDNPVVTEFQGLKTCSTRREEERRREFHNPGATPTDHVWSVEELLFCREGVL